MSSIAYEDLLRKDGRVITHVVGWSMMPLLRNRESIVIVEAPNLVKPKKRDVVLYKTENRYIRDSEGRYVAKDDILYQTYCRMLPCIRLIRYLKIRAKRYLKKNL